MIASIKNIGLNDIILSSYFQLVSYLVDTCGTSNVITEASADTTNYKQPGTNLLLASGNQFGKRH